MKRWLAVGLSLLLLTVCQSPGPEQEPELPESPAGEVVILCGGEEYTPLSNLLSRTVEGETTQSARRHPAEVDNLLEGVDYAEDFAILPQGEGAGQVFYTTYNTGETEPVTYSREMPERNGKGPTVLSFEIVWGEEGNQARMQYFFKLAPPPKPEEGLKVTEGTTWEAAFRVEQGELLEWLEEREDMMLDYRSPWLMTQYGPDHPLFRYDRIGEFLQNCIDSKPDSIAFVGAGERLSCYVDWYYTNGRYIRNEFSYVQGDSYYLTRTSIQSVGPINAKTELIFSSKSHEKRRMPRYGMEAVSFCGQPEPERLLLEYLRSLYQEKGGNPDREISLERGEALEIQGEMCQTYDIVDTSGTFRGRVAVNEDFSKVYQQEMVNNNYLLEVRPKQASN